MSGDKTIRCVTREQQAGRRMRAIAMARPLDYGAANDPRLLAIYTHDLNGGFRSPGARIRGIVTFDVGMSERPGVLRADGTPFRNDTFERCLHLSLSEVTGGGPQRVSSTERGAWERAIFTAAERRMLVRAVERGPVFHCRLFLDELLQPVKPVGEVYQRREAGRRA